MTIRAARIMTSIFLVRDDRVLLLYRIGSSAIPDSWVGIGGHVEPDEVCDPESAAIRELREEVGVTAEDISDLALRYVSLRDPGHELRFTYYFTADLFPDTPEPTACPEGELRWFEIVDPDTTKLDMPPTAAAALQHWLTEGRHDNAMRSIVMTSNGAQVLQLAHGL